MTHCTIFSSVIPCSCTNQGRLLITIFLLLMAYSPTKSQSVDAANHILLVKHSEDFTIIGDGTDWHWNQSKWTSIPARNKGSEYDTQFKVLYSNKGIYVLFQCIDKTITATLTTDFSDLYLEDVAEFFFWPDENIPLYFEYEISPLNFELPILVPNLNGSAFGWKPWHYEGDRLTRHATQIKRGEAGVTSWTAEIFIPFKLLNPIISKAPVKGDRWRANFYRIDYDNGTCYFMWQPTNNNFHEFRKYGTIQFD